MRSLIRPALFMVARLGLLFSVIACVFGQTWQGVAYSHKIVVGIGRAGMVIVINSATLGNWGIQEQFDLNRVKDFLIGKDLRAGDTHLSFSGVAVQYGELNFALGAYHWLVITISALFYAVLMWVYRKKTPALSEAVESHTRSRK